MRRVVVTGLGAVTPLGVGLKTTWPSLLASRSGIRSLLSREDGPAFESLPSRIAGLVPLGSKADGAWDPNDWLEKEEQRKMALFTQYAVAAAEEAMDDSGLHEYLSKADRWDRTRMGTTIGSGIGSLQDAYNTTLTHHQNGYKRIPPLFVPRLLINLAAFHIASRFGLHGPSTAPTTACTTGAHAIIDAANMIRLGDVDAMVVGASEACIHPLAVAGFARARSLSTSFNDRPEEASRPFDRHRDGFVIGEGAGVLVLEELEFARRRGARILAEVLGYGMSCDADHMTKPLSDGWGAEVAMRQALWRAGETLWRAGESLQVGGSDGVGGASPKGSVGDGRMRKMGQALVPDYINAHATSTVLGDVAELRAIKRAVSASAQRAVSESAQRAISASSKGAVSPSNKPVGENLTISSTKSSIGHLLGAAGAVEAIFSILAIRDGVVPPTLNLGCAGELGGSRSEAGTGAGTAAAAATPTEPIRDAVANMDKDNPYANVNFAPHKSQKMLPPSSSSSSQREKTGRKRRRTALSNSFGFGGTNASLVFGEWVDE